MTSPAAQAPAANGRLTSLASQTGALAEKTYVSAKAYVPESVKPRVDQVEGAVAEVAAPYVHKAQDTGATLLRAADDRIDTALNTAQKVYSDNSAYLQAQLARQAEFHKSNLQSYKEAREAYLKKVEDAVEFVKQKGLTGSARAAADEVLARVGEAKVAVLGAPGYLLHKVQDAVDRLLAFGPVHSAVESAKPSLSAAKGQYLRVHDSVVATPQYKQVYDLAGTFAARAQQTWIVAKAKENLLPYAQPTMDSVVSSPYYSSLVQHLQPIEPTRA
ncbi:hypothetical protein D9Q98_001600 [Chlorella vulgaris]|uniref:Uncharacterized protein n=1 Tax=Chlorella vulgaris TaxID=3077 RepID=A0A9D4TUM8_CHLVU|nr:hypothetical protein D9Q98_001600 [Chlorella vulgaris]